MLDTRIGSGLHKALPCGRQLASNLQLNSHPLKTGKRCEQRIDDAQPKRIGRTRCLKPMSKVFAPLERLFNDDLVHVGGSSRRKLVELPDNVRRLENTERRVGGARLWEHP